MMISRDHYFATQATRLFLRVQSQYTLSSTNLVLLYSVRARVNIYAYYTNTFPPPLKCISTDEVVLSSSVRENLAPKRTACISDMLTIDERSMTVSQMLVPQSFQHAVAVSQPSTARFSIEQPYREETFEQ